MLLNDSLVAKAVVLVRAGHKAMESRQGEGRRGVWQVGGIAWQGNIWAKPRSIKIGGFNWMGTRGLQERGWKSIFLSKEHSWSHTMVWVGRGFKTYPVPTSRDTFH